MEKLEVYEAAVQLLENEGHEASVRDDYSGRGMFGSTTLAIVTGAPPAYIGWAITAAVAEASSSDTDPYEVADLALDLLPGHSDNMGLGMVYY